MALITGQALRVRREIPHEPGQWVDIRPLSWKRLDDAKQARLAEQARLVGLMGGYSARTPTATNGSAEPADEDADVTLVASNGHLDPKDYDWGAVFRGGVLAWSYAPKINPGDFDLLDATTAEWLVGEILALHDHSEDARKND